MKKLAAIVLAVVLALALCACGKTYTCRECGKSTTKAYYAVTASVDDVLCEDCARIYWMPIPYENCRVK